MSVTAIQAPVVLEPPSQALAEATAKPPFLDQWRGSNRVTGRPSRSIT
jgi:hypothetical protein